MANYANVQAFANRLTTEMNSLADAANSAASSAIDNSSNLYGYADVSLALASINPTSAAARVDIHLLPRGADGLTYVDISASTRVGTLVVTTGSSAKLAVLPRVSIPAGFFKWAVTNRTGVTLAASGSILADRLHDGKGA